MKRISALACLVLTAGFAAAQSTAPAAPAAAAPAGPTKIAVINFQPVLATTNEGRRALEALQKKYEPTQTHLKALNDEIESLKKQFQVDGPKLSQAEQASRQQTIDTKTKQLELEGEDANTRMQNDLQETFAKLADKVGKVMVAYATNNGFTLILDYNTQQQSPILWYAQSTDISQAVVDAYNATTPTITAPTAPAAAAPAARPTTPRPAGPAK